MIHFSELTKEEREAFGDGCSYVPDFIFTADCRHHDFNYQRGGNIKDKLKADKDMCWRMIQDSYLPGHYIVSIVYWFSLTFLPVSYFKFTYGRYRDKNDILILDNIRKKYKD